MKNQRQLHYFFIVICSAALLLLQGCLQDYLPRQFASREPGEAEHPQEMEKKEAVYPEQELPPGMISVRVYFLEEKGHYLLPITQILPWTEGVARAALEKLIEGPTPAQEMRYGLRSPLSPLTKIRGLTIRDGLAKLDLSDSFLSYDPGEERAVLNSIIFTLLQFPSVQEVELLVEGETLEQFPGGTPGGGKFSRERGINLEVPEEINFLEETRLVTIYFCTLLGDNRIFFVPVSRLVEKKKDIFEATLEELLKGPRMKSHLFSELPPGTTWREIKTEGDALIIDLSRELLNYKGGLRGEKNIYNQIALTFTEIPGVEKVHLLVEGEKITLPYGTSFREPLRPLLLLNLLEAPG